MNGVVDQHVVEHLNIADVRCVNHDFPVFFRYDDLLGLTCFFQGGQGFCHHQGQRVILNGLYQIPHRIYQIPFHSVLCKLGFKNKSHLSIDFSQALGGFHAVGELHINVQKNDVIRKIVAAQKIQGIGKRYTLKRFLPPTEISCQMLFQRGSMLGFIIHKCNSDHGSFPFCCLSRDGMRMLLCIRSNAL